jgi:hypothetical protein
MCDGIFTWLESSFYNPLKSYVFMAVGNPSWLRDRPFNLKEGLWFFVSFRIFFSDNTRIRIFIFFQNLTLGYMTKTLNQIIFFFLHQNQNIFFSNIGNQNIFLEKNHNPPFKLNGRSLTWVHLPSPEKWQNTRPKC